ncbi:Probable Zn dependent nucleoside deaminase [Alteracholeplasma palmae J233]|uniref:tRNA-specific adenosine deaminase n=1 Tax=Alteracholeplasma palmae (strain ATCC 49389 / J233) TaxID=1318466 RepID=U4KSE6_ALTPJ|nr:nucleoside deaminase [Alteracholeplasma palmae]CCV64941.1 Probable Zn dependent nucleoside deaminase [Alteracholeplasma palmae J233]
MNIHEKFMLEALKEAKKAYKKMEVPVGAVAVLDGKIIARAHNNRETKQKFSGHAEFIVMEKASKKVQSWRLSEVSIYVTLEPCLMCAGALIQSRVKALYYGSKDLKSGSIDSIINLQELPYNHKIEYESGILAEESTELLKRFFRELRENKK